MRFRNRTLLALRTLAVLLIVFGFAWPYLRKLDHHSISRRTVYILDNTMSRQAGNGFALDKERIIRELNSGATKTQAAVLELAAGTRVIAPFGTDRQTAIEAVRQLKPSFGRGSYAAAFREANTLLDEVSAGARQIVLLGDNQANQWQEDPPASPFLDRVQVELPKSKVQTLPNLWLFNGQAQRVYLGDKSRINFSVWLGHLGPAPHAKVSLRANGRAVFERVVDLRDMPESMLLQGQCEADPDAWVRAEALVEGTPDALEADNHFYFAVPPMLEGKVALLARSVFLTAALSPEVMRGHWNRQVLDLAKARTAPAGPLADVLCVESAYLQGPEGRSLVRNYLDTGRGVLLFVNRLSPAIDANLRELGFEPDGTVTPGQNNPEHFQFVTSNHPICQPFNSAEFGTLAEVSVSRYAKLQPKAARPLIFSQSGHCLFGESTKYPGKLFVCAFGIDREETSWPVHPTFVPFLDLALQAARPQQKIRASFEPGELADVALPAGSDAQTVSISSNGQILSKTKVVHRHALLQLPDQPGVFGFVLGETAEPWHLVTVNAAPQESQLIFAGSLKPLQEWAIGAPHRTTDSAVATLPDLGYSSPLAHRFWWWILVAGLVALVLETAWVGIKGEKV